MVNSKKKQLNIGITLPYISPEEHTKMVAERERVFNELMALGINTMMFDGGRNNPDETTIDEEQWSKDAAMASIYVSRNEAVPEDLKARLLKVKQLREQHGK